MRIGTSYRQKNNLTDSYDAIVIGSGIGGLVSAALLTRHAGKRVLVLERHYTAGGFTHTFHRSGGYEWDVGVHYIGEVNDPDNDLRRIFDDVTGGALAWADMGDVYDTIIIGDDRYEFRKGVDHFRAQLKTYFPAEAGAIDRYIARVQATVRKGVSYFLDKALPIPLSRVIGPALRWRLSREARQTTQEVLDQLTSNRRLQAVLTGQFGDYGLPPSQSSFFMHALVVNHYFSGGCYPVGGSSRIAACIEPVIREGGGALVTNAEVTEIVVHNKRAQRVRLADGREISAPVIISDAGAPLTYGKLLAKEVRADLGFYDKLAAIKPSTAHISAYLGLEGSASDLGLKKSNLWVYPDEHHDRNLARYLSDPAAPLPVSFISFPSAKDPDFARRAPGKSTIEAVTLVPYERFAPWQDARWGHRGKDYEALKERLAEDLCESLFKQCPNLRGKIKHCELSTPLSTRTFAAHPRGEIYGLTHTPHRFAQSWLRPRTPIRGLYLTGADICSGGVAGATFGGLLTASTILYKDLRATIARQSPATPRRAPSPA